VIYLAGFHQDGDRIAVFEGVTCAVIVQAVAHASTTGSMGVHRLLCNNEVLPTGMQKYFTERFLYIDGPFLPNSFKTFFLHDVERLSQLRNNAEIRRKERETRGMPSAKIIAIIAKPDRLEKIFFDMAIELLKANADTVLLLIDHGYPAFQRRKEASFKEQGLQGRIVFMPFQALQNGELHRFLALIDVYQTTISRHRGVQRSHRGSGRPLG
jgi:predicted O-linked N-acetylglucosamine transferase (SPINDLY family)